MPKVDKQDESGFKQSIEKAISEGRHVDYLKDVLKKYEDYLKTFSGIFTSTAPKSDIYAFEVVYEYDRKVNRVIQILGSQNFEDLASHIILSMGWVNDHMHGFDLTGKKTLPASLDINSAPSSLSFYAEGWEDDPHPYYKTSQILISDIDYKKQPVLDFTFDYGDNHRFKITFIERNKIDRHDKLKDFPLLAESHGQAPVQYPPVQDY
jgi:hypothetical protein